MQPNYLVSPKLSRIIMGATSKKLKNRECSDESNITINLLIFKILFK